MRRGGTARKVAGRRHAKQEERFLENSTGAVGHGSGRRKAAASVATEPVKQQRQALGLDAERAQIGEFVCRSMDGNDYADRRVLFDTRPVGRPV